MEEKIVELVFIVDASGSMGNLRRNTINGINSVIEKQRIEQGKENSRVYLTTIIFNHEIKIVHDRVDFKNVQNMSKRDYRPGGRTALYDTIGKTIQYISKLHKDIRETDIPHKTSFVIITDGMDNHSVDYTCSKVKDLIMKKKLRGWEFVFLGANIDSEIEAEKIGISQDEAVNWLADEEGTDKMFEAVSMFSSFCMDFSSAFQGLKEDYQQRKK